MTNRTTRLQSITDFIVENVGEHRSDIGSLVATGFNMSRQAANKHLRRLTEAGVLENIGNTRSKEYSLAVLDGNSIEIAVTPELAEHEVWMEHIFPFLGELSRNVEDICQFGFTEMVNNVVEHSSSPVLNVPVSRTAADILMTVEDRGIGIFRKIQDEFGYRDPRDALLQLSKGKLTTAKEAHSGEGFFFTSRMFDSFILNSGALQFSRMNSMPGDWLIEVDDREPIQGTEIYMEIRLTANRTTKKIFDAAMTEFEEFAFIRTHVPIKLAVYGNEQLVSRSQAKRVLARFDSFQEIMLDFQGVDTIGPAFADEIFRVFANQHPGIELIWERTTPAVDQMIRRAKSNAP